MNYHVLARTDRHGTAGRTALSGDFDVTSPNIVAREFSFHDFLIPSGQGRYSRVFFVISRVKSRGLFLPARGVQWLKTAIMTVLFTY